jgi:hypothetical protein
MFRASMMMVLLGLLTTAMGCDDDKKPAGTDGAPSATAKATAATTAATTAKAAASAAKTDGNPTIAQLREAKKLLKPFKPWGESYDAVVAMIGPHQAVDYDGILVWTVVEGDKCVKLTLEKSGDKTGMTGLMEYDKAGGSMFEKCRDKIN